MADSSVQSARPRRQQVQGMNLKVKFLESYLEKYLGASLSRCEKSR